MSQAQARVAAFEDRRLLTKGKVLKDEAATGAESVSHSCQARRSSGMFPHAAGLEIVLGERTGAWRWRLRRCTSPLRR
jgi:hypothetical protein